MVVMTHKVVSEMKKISRWIKEAKERQIGYIHVYHLFEDNENWLRNNGYTIHKSNGLYLIIWE